MASLFKLIITCSLTLYLTLTTLFSDMTHATEFTQEPQLEKKLTNEIADFWQSGHFASFQGKDNKRVNYAAFVNKPQGKCLVIVPGRSEGYLKYKELAYDLAQYSINIFIIDHRGQGLSERLLDNPHKGYVKQFDDYAEDLHVFINSEVRPQCHSNEKPLILAHSMGGAISLRLMQNYPDTIESAFLSSPMIAINAGGLPEWLATALISTGSFLNKLFTQQAWYFIGQNDHQVTPYSDNVLMQSETRYQMFLDTYKDNPSLQLGGVTIHWLKQAITAKADIFADITKLTTPITILQAGADTVVDNNAQDTFCQQLSQVASLQCQTGNPIIINDAYHELFFESDEYRNQALAEVKKWLENNS